MGKSCHGPSKGCERRSFIDFSNDFLQALLSDLQKARHVDVRDWKILDIKLSCDHPATLTGEFYEYQDSANFRSYLCSCCWFIVHLRISRSPRLELPS